MNQKEQINHLIKKGLFDKQLKIRKEKKKQKKLKLISLFIFILIILFTSILIYQKPSDSSPENPKIQLVEEPKQEKLKILKSILPFSLGKAGPPVNILALGRPGQGYSGQNLTDTIILIHLEPAQERAILISLPRDLLVKVSENNNRLTKINSLYGIIGIEGLKDKIKEITGLTVDYHILVDLVVTQEIIELMDGLNIYVPQDINDPFFPGPNHSYQKFNLSAGWRYLDGPTALKYIRTRYTSLNGDFDRMARQQQVITLLKQKVLELNLLWDFPTYLKMFNSLKNNIETDLGVIELKDLWEAVRKIKADQITQIVIDKRETNLLRGGRVPFGQQMASVVYPIAGQGNYEDIKKHINKFIKL